MRLPAGYGKVAVVDELRAGLPIAYDRLVYVGDGSSDLHVMLHVNRLDGLTIAVSENRYITQVAARTVLSDDALSVLVPILEDLLGWNSTKVRLFFESHGFALREWDKIRPTPLPSSPPPPRNGACSDVRRGTGRIPGIADRCRGGLAPAHIARVLGRDGRLPGARTGGLHLGVAHRRDERRAPPGRRHARPGLLGVAIGPSPPFRYAARW